MTKVSLEIEMPKGFKLTDDKKDKLREELQIAVDEMWLNERKEHRNERLFGKVK